LKSKSKIEVIDEGSYQAVAFRRVESTSSYKNLQRQVRMESEEPYETSQVRKALVQNPHFKRNTNECEIELVESHWQNQAPEYAENTVPVCENQFKRKEKSSVVGTLQVDPLSSESLITPKERNIAPKAFKRSDAESVASKKPPKLYSPEWHKIENKILQSHLQSTIRYPINIRNFERTINDAFRKVEAGHEKAMESQQQQYEDQLAQMYQEKEKEYVLILDAKMIEHEDQLLDTENRLHREYIDKIGTSLTLTI